MDYGLSGEAGPGSAGLVISYLLFEYLLDINLEIF